MGFGLQVRLAFMYKFKNNSSSYATPILNMASSPKEGNKLESAHCQQPQQNDHAGVQEHGDGCDVTNEENEHHECFGRTMTSSSLDSVKTMNFSKPL